MQTIGKQELQFLKIYNMYANPVRPFLTRRMAKQGIEFHRSAVQRDLPAKHAAFPSVAAVWAAIAYGASLVHDSRTATYADCARSALQFCFDVATPETIRAYLLVEAWNTVAARKYSCFDPGMPSCVDKFDWCCVLWWVCFNAQLRRRRRPRSRCSSSRRLCGTSCDVRQISV
jgi:hypothetical protein